MNAACGPYIIACTTSAAAIANVIATAIRVSSSGKNANASAERAAPRRRRTRRVDRSDRTASRRAESSARCRRRRSTARSARSVRGHAERRREIGQARTLAASEYRTSGPMRTPPPSRSLRQCSRKTSPTGARACVFSRSSSPEQRRLLHADADPQAEPDQHDAGEERQRQPHARKLSSWKLRSHQRDRSGRQQRAERRSHLRPRGIAAATTLIAVLDGEQHRSRPLAAERRALHEAQRDQQGRAQHAGGRIGRQHADQRRRHAHHHQRRDEHEASAVAIAEMPEDHAADRSREVADRERRERQDRAGQRIERREEQLLKTSAASVL